MKQLCTVLLLIAAVFMVTSCDNLFYNAEVINAKDLPAISGTTASSESEFEAGLSKGVSTGAVPAAGLSIAGDPNKLVVKSMPMMMKQSEIEAVSKGLTGGFNVDTDTTDDHHTIITTTLNANAKLSTDPDITASGNYKMVVDTLLETLLPPVGKATATWDGDIKLVISTFGSSEDDLYIAGGKTNFKTKGNYSMNINKTEFTYKMYNATAFYLGFSLNECEGHKAAKYIVSCKYVWNNSGSLSSATGDMKGDLTMEYVAKAYDASNKKVWEKTYTETDWNEKIDK